MERKVEMAIHLWLMLTHPETGMRHAGADPRREGYAAW